MKSYIGFLRIGIGLHNCNALETEALATGWAEDVARVGAGIDSGRVGGQRK